MSCRLPLAVLTLGLTLGTSARADDIFLKETRDPVPAGMAVDEALKKAPGDAPVDAKMEENIEIVTRHYVYQLTEKIKKETPGQMDRAVDHCDREYQKVFTDPEAKNTAVQSAYLKKALEALNRLLAEPTQHHITRINAARLLARLAKHSAREETADLLVKVITEATQIDGARYYACQGLKELLARVNKKGGPGIKDATQRAAIVTALVAFIERKPPYTPNTPEESDGLRYIRREAIRALAQARVSRVEGPNGHAALALARVVGKDGSLSPEPRLDERIEAAIGLCLLPADPQKDLQPGYLAHLVGQCLKDFALVSDRRLLPAKVLAARWNDALAAMAATHDDPNVKSVANLGA